MRHDTRGVWISQALSRPRAFTSDVLGLRRNMVVLSLAIFCVGLGEELAHEGHQCTLLQRQDPQ